MMGEKERKKGRRSQVDKVSKGKLRWYRMSCKEDSEQGQRCRNSIPEPRQEQVIKTYSARDGHGPKHAASPRKTPEEEEHSASLIFLQISWRSFDVSLIFALQKQSLN